MSDTLISASGKLGQMRSWSPTMKLRILTSPSCLHAGTPVIIEQLWTDTLSGDVEWRKVEIVPLSREDFKEHMNA